MVRAPRYIYLSSLLALFVAVAISGSASAQNNYSTNNYSTNETKGPTASEMFSGTSSSVSGMLSFDTSVGWNFTKNFGADVGVPYFLITRPGIFEDTAGYRGYVNFRSLNCTFFAGCFYTLNTSPRMWAGELGDVYADFHYGRTYGKYNFVTVLTGDFPTASFRKGLTDGRVQWDWFNHVDTNFHGFDPFLNFGLANGRMDQHFLPRPFNTNLPFRTFGYMADFEGGLQYKLFRRLTVGASYWDVLPMGPQKIYSELVWQGLAPPSGSYGFTPIPRNGTQTLPAVVGFLHGDPNHGRFWNNRFETIGNSFIARDNGYSASIGFSPHKDVDVVLGYNHSVRYALDTVSFTVAFNANSVARKLTNY